VAPPLAASNVRAMPLMPIALNLPQPAARAAAPPAQHGAWPWDDFRRS
jgi:hypothetical protein